MAPAIESSPPITTTGNTAKTANSVAGLTPAAPRGKTEKKMPPTAARAAPIAQASEKIIPTLMPCAKAVSWSKAVARMATPVLVLKNQASRNTRPAITTRVTSWVSAMRTLPNGLRLVAPHGSPRPRDSLRIRSLVMVPMTRARPSVMMATANSGLPIIGLIASRSTMTPSRAVTAMARSADRIHCPQPGRDSRYRPGKFTTVAK